MCTPTGLLLVLHMRAEACEHVVYGHGVNKRCHKAWKEDQDLCFSVPLASLIIWKAQQVFGVMWHSIWSLNSTCVTHSYTFGICYTFGWACTAEPPQTTTAMHELTILYDLGEKQ